jgi:hypothetical protein
VERGAELPLTPLTSLFLCFSPQDTTTYGSLVPLYASLVLSTVDEKILYCTVNAWIYADTTVDCRAHDAGSSSEVDQFSIAPVSSVTLCDKVSNFVYSANRLKIHFFIALEILVCRANF